MSEETVIGSVELTNARLYFVKPKNTPKIACEQFREWLHIPKAVIDPSDYSRLVMIAKSSGNNTRPGTTVRVLRSWYIKTKAALAIVNEGAYARVPENKVTYRMPVKVNGGRAGVPAGLTARYYNFGR